LSPVPPTFSCPANKTRLIKFHGCAVKAQGDPGQYRQWLVASNDQVAAFCTQANNQGLVTALTHIVGSKRTLMLGLSAQDSNIQGIFNKAANELTWQLGDPLPSYVFSEQELGMDQRSLLKNVYRDQITGTNLTAVFEAARIQAYAKPLLTALLLDVWSRKLQALILSRSRPASACGASTPVRRHRVASQPSGRCGGAGARLHRCAPRSVRPRL
jgi:hypothetical protein